MLPSKRYFNRTSNKHSTAALLGAIPEGLDGTARKCLLNILLTAAPKGPTIRLLQPVHPKYDVWVKKISIHMIH